MPVMVVKPDGTQLFFAWYDRRNDTNNSLIDVYGRFATIAANGNVSFGNEFRISTVSFPPVFAGTRGDIEPIYKQPGFYDPVNPPGGVNLNWWYSEWPAPLPPPSDHIYDTFETYIRHVGEYNALWSDPDFVYYTWTDYRQLSYASIHGRHQGDIRFLKLSWPE
jgi:hypothetical protein